MEYYPIDEILANKDEKKMFQKIDVWMLGKFLNRMFSVNIFKSWVDAMTEPI